MRGKGAAPITGRSTNGNVSVPNIINDVNFVVNPGAIRDSGILIVVVHLLRNIMFDSSAVRTTYPQCSGEYTSPWTVPFKGTSTVT